MVSASEVISAIEAFAPLALQEAYDNSGLLTGSRGDEVSGVLLCVDITSEVMDEARSMACNMIISHHPLLFKPLKRISGETLPERLLVRAIKENMIIYAAHTNLDMIPEGVSGRMADKLGLTETAVLVPSSQGLLKLVVFVPESHAGPVGEALFGAGAGRIGKYDSCSFQSQGTGTFRGDADAKPFAGKPGTLNREPEVRIETILPAYLKDRVISAMIEVHPYEEVAYDLYPLENRFTMAGTGLCGHLPEPIDEGGFLSLVKSAFKIPMLKHSPLTGKRIHKIALCGGSGGSLLQAAIRCGADAFVTADLKYHSFFETEGKLLLVDAGHFETEQFVPEILYEVLSEKLPKFAVHLSAINSNPVNYY